MTKNCFVTLDNLVELAPEHVQPPYKYGYAYTISIHNHSPYIVQIRSRKWIIRDGDMKDRVVEGEGVVGELPILKPGQKFTYRSYMIMQNRFGSALGVYLGKYSPNLEPDGEFNDHQIFLINGEDFEIAIPEFQLIHQNNPTSSLM